MLAVGPTGGTCGGAFVGFYVITMNAGATIPPGGCTIVATLASLLPGAANNTTSALQTSAGTAAPASATLTVMPAVPTLSKNFVPFAPFIGVGDVSALLITIGNHNSIAITLTAPFVDLIPPPLVANSGHIGTCAGVLVAAAAIILPAGATIPPGGCTIVVTVTSAAAADVTNTTSALVTNIGTAAPASATLSVIGTYALFTTSGGGQSTTVNTALGSVLAATVTNAGAPFPGIVVMFTLPASGPSGTFASGGTSASAVTDANGVASSPSITANGIAGSYVAVVSAPIVPVSRFFALTNIAASVPEAPIPALGAVPLLLLIVGMAAVAWSARRRGL